LFVFSKIFGVLFSYALAFSGSFLCLLIISALIIRSSLLYILYRICVRILYILSNVITIVYSFIKYFCDIVWL
jgi:hypothetical protein